MKGTKNRIQSFIDTYNSLMEKCEIIVDYANTLENLPPQGEGARAAVEEELNTLFGRMHKQLNKLQKHLIDKVWGGGGRVKDYKRLTERRSFGVIDNCANCPNINNKQGCTDKKCYEIMRNRLADLEDKIESGELCDREEVKKETAKEIIKMLVGHKMIDKGAHMSWVIVKQDVLFIAKKYGVKLEEQQ